MSMELANILGWIATTLFTICYVPQIIKMHKQKTVDGASFWLFGISFVANIVALAYAALINQKPLQVKYTLALAFLAVTIFVYIKVWRTNEKLKVVQKEK